NKRFIGVYSTTPTVRRNGRGSCGAEPSCWAWPGWPPSFSPLPAGERGEERAAFDPVHFHRTAHGYTVQVDYLRGGRENGQCRREGRLRPCRPTRWYHERLSPHQRIDAVMPASGRKASKG